MPDHDNPILPTLNKLAAQSHDGAESGVGSHHLGQQVYAVMDGNNPKRLDLLITYVTYAKLGKTPIILDVVTQKKAQDLRGNTPALKKLARQINEMKRPSSKKKATTENTSSIFRFSLS